MQTQRYTTHLAYDLNEAFEQFCARRQHAWEQGRLAVRERRIKAHIYLFYEAIIERVGGNRYTWVAEDTWAAEFQVDESTIKRWIAKLVQVGLIRRQRRFGTSSCTYITAYDRRTVVLDGTAAVDQNGPENQDHAEVEQEAHATQGNDAVNPSIPGDQGSVSEELSLRRKHAPTISASMRQDPVNVEHLTLGGGGVGNRYKQLPVAPDVIRLLEQEGVNGFFVAPTLRQKSMAELRAVSSYLDKQTNVHARDKLFAALVLQDFGAQLLAGRVMSQDRQTTKPQRNAAGTPSIPNDHLKYVSGALAPYIKGWNPPPTVPEGHPQTEPTPAAAVPPPTPSPTLTQTWQQVLASLRQVLPASEIKTWFQDVALVALDDERAIVGVPNIFARDELMRCYQAQIAQALHASCGRSVPVQIEIGG